MAFPFPFFRDLRATGLESSLDERSLSLFNSSRPRFPLKGVGLGPSGRSGRGDGGGIPVSVEVRTVLEVSLDIDANHGGTTADLVESSIGPRVVSLLGVSELPPFMVSVLSLFVASGVLPFVMSGLPPFSASGLVLLFVVEVVVLLALGA